MISRICGAYRVSAHNPFHFLGKSKDEAAKFAAHCGGGALTGGIDFSVQVCTYVSIRVGVICP